MTPHFSQCRCPCRTECGISLLCFCVRPVLRNFKAIADRHSETDEGTFGRLLNHLGQDMQGMDFMWYGLAVGHVTFEKCAQKKC